VTADGRTIRSSETEEPELFWGIRGAGWNFGVVTAFEFALHEFSGVLHRGVRIYPASHVHELWATFRDYTADAPDAISTILTIARAEPASDYPDSVAGGPIVIVGYNHSGDANVVERDIAPLRAGPKPASVTGGSQPYLEVQTAHDNLMGFGGRSFIRSGYANDVSAATLDALVEHATHPRGEGSISITAQGGAITRLPDEATAFAGRSAGFDVSADTAWSDPAEDDACAAWTRAAMAIVEPDSVPGGYLNGQSDAGSELTEASYGVRNLARLRDLKRAWDPDNVFHLNHNIAP
jgi:FAD/FMN-containing dehydrogenase